MRHLLMWVVLWAVYLFVVQPLILSDQGVVIVWVGGGLAAGLFVVLPRSQWGWGVAVTAIALPLAYRHMDIAVELMVGQAVLDLLAILIFAWVISSHRQPNSGLGSDVLWLAVASAVAVGLRTAPLLIGLAANMPWTPGALPEVALGTVVGMLAGTGTVIGLSQWRGALGTGQARGEYVLGIVVMLAALGLLLFTPLGALLPGVQYLFIPLLIASAVRYPVPITAGLTGLTVLVLAVAAANGTGAYESLASGLPADVFATQMYLTVLTVSVFVLASVVSERVSVERSYAQSSAMLGAVFRESPVPAAWVTIADDAQPVVLEANPAFLNLIGLPGDEVRGARLSSLLMPAELFGEIDLEAGLDLHAIGRDGNVRWLRPTLSRRFTDPFPGDVADDSDDEYAVLVLEDVTADRVSEELLRQQSRRDSLTGLPNRVALIERLEEALEHATEEQPAGLLILDIDDLKVVNNGLGHLVGDQLIIQMAERLTETLHSRDLLVRTGGDEFAVLRPQPVASDPLDDLSQRILLCVTEPFVLDNRPLSVSISVGAAESTPATTLPGDLLRGADIALQRAKGGGRRQVARFEPGEDKPALERMGTEDLLRKCLDGSSLVCLFQPIVLMSSRRVVSVETLVRLPDPNGGLVGPGAFLPLAAELGLLGVLTDQVVRQSVEAAARWANAGHDVRVAFNAPPQWLTPTALETVASIMDEHGVPFASMTAEVTEEETLSAGRTAIETLTELRGMGMHVAIDDFGTGYAGLDSFRSVPADIVKIDRSFIEEMLRNDEDYELVRSMLDLIYRFGKKAVAEGIETAEQMSVLHEMGCEYGQGFYLGKPMRFDEVPVGEVLPRGLPVMP